MQNETKPLVESVQKYVDSLHPKTEAVKELHAMRKKQFNLWFKGMNLRFKAVKIASDPAADQQKVKILLQKAMKKILEAAKKRKQVDKKFKELAEKYNVKLKGNED